MRICSAGACPPQGSGWGLAESAVLIRCTKPQLQLFIPWCAGACRHTRLARKHVPDSDPGSIPAPAGDTNHRRPNNDSPASQEKCSAGACPQLGAGCVAQTTPDPFFIPWCAGTSRHQRLVRKHVPDSDPGCALQSTSMTALHRRNVPNCRPPADGGMRKCSAGACPPLGSGWGLAESAVPIRCTKPQLRLFIPWCAGACRHTRLARKHVPDSDPGSIPAPAGDTNHRRPNNDSPGPQERNVALGLVPSDDQASRPLSQSGLPTRHPGKSMPRTPIRGRSPGGGGNPIAQELVTSPWNRHPKSFILLIQPSQDRR